MIGRRTRRLKKQRNARQAEEAEVRLKVLTLRELEVLQGLAQGLPHKTIAYDLEISPLTVEIHRAHLMEKLDASSLHGFGRTNITSVFAASDGRTNASAPRSRRRRRK